MNLIHGAAKAIRQITRRQMDVLLGRFETAMACEACNFMKIPPGARHVGQAQVTKRMGGEEGTPARSAIERTTFDHVHSVMGAA
jgi:hypothetical protein